MYLQPRSRRFSRWSASLGVVISLAIAETTSAGVIMTYTSRALWEADALAAGLTVTTEDFATEPVGFPGFTVGGVDFTTTGPWDSINERVGYTSGGGVLMRFDFTGGSVPLFGFGIDMGLALGVLTATDRDGAFVNNHSGANTFLGLISTAPFDPANPLSPLDPFDDGRLEIATGGLAGMVFADNLSVATASVPLTELGTLGLVGVGLGALGFRRIRAGARTVSPRSSRR